MGQLIQELKRRNVIRVAIAYAVAAWILIEVSATTFPMLRLPDWTATFVMVLLMIGFPMALILSWAFEITPEGIKLEKHVVRDESITHKTGRNIDYIIIAMLVVALGYFGYDKFVLDPSQDAELVQTTTEAVTDQLATETEVAAETDKSIAVLPFADMSESQDQEWFADGLAEEILNALVRTPDLLVASRTSSFAYKQTLKDAVTIARDLQVAYILEGSVRRTEGRLRVTAQLIRASDGFHSWSENYDRSVDDVIAIQEDIAIQIANALQTAMDPEALAAMASAGTLSVPAYEAYLKGNSYFTSGNDKSLVFEALAEWERAVALDPEFAFAHGRLANFWREQVIATDYFSNLTDLSRTELQERFVDAINSAIEHEKNPVSMLYHQAYKAEIEMKYQQALDLVAEYIAQRPNDKEAQAHQLRIMRKLALHDESAVEIARLMNRGEHHGRVLVNSLQNLRYSRDPELMRAFSRFAIEQHSENASVLYQAHRLLLWSGDFDRAGKLLPAIESSSRPEYGKALAALRQACAEKRITDANRIHTERLVPIANRLSLKWVGYKIMGDDESAHEIVMEYDQKQEVLRVSGLLMYGEFDPTPYPNLMARMAGQGIEDREIFDIPYRCDR